MDMTDREAEPFFSHPVRQIVLMLVALGLVGVGAYLAYSSVAPVFLANPYLNGFILLVFVIGVLACFWQVLQLISSVAWIEGFATNRSGHELTTPPQLLAPLAAMMRSRGANMKVSASSTRSILDSVVTRIDEAREITRYIVNLLIFLGLLGTFYGLATTVPALVETIRSLDPQDGEGGVQIFARLMGGLEAQLGGMGVAFASSLLGLAGSLIVGLLELFASHGQNRFYRELEEWLSTFTRLGFSTGEGETSAEQNFMVGVLDTMAEQMEHMQLMFSEAAENRADVDEKLGKLTQSIDVLASHMEGDSLVKSALLAKLDEDADTEDGLDSEARLHLRSIDVQMLKILEEISAGRQESVIDLRNDIATLTQTIRKAAKMDQG